MTFPSNSPRHAYPRRFRPQYKKVPPIELDTASDANANADENATATTAAVSVSHAEKSRHAVTSRSPQRAQHIPLESSYRTPVDDPNFHDDSGYLDPRINPISKSKMSKGNRKPKSVPKRIAIMAICLVVVLVIGVGATAFALYNAGSQNLHKPADNIATQDAAISYDEGRTIYYDGNTYT